MDPLATRGSSQLRGIDSGREGGWLLLSLLWSVAVRGNLLFSLLADRATDNHHGDTAMVS